MSKPIEIVAVKKSTKQPEPQVQQASQNLTEKKVIKSASGKVRTAKKPQTEPPQNQSVGLFPGCLTLIDEQLSLRCSDGALLPVCGIDQKLSLWLLSHPCQMFSPEPVLWLVYPKSDFKTDHLTVHLKARQNEGKAFLESDQCRIKGMVLSIDGDKAVIGIRRNLSFHAYQELKAKQMLGDFQQFRITVYSLLTHEAGQFVELDCRRVGDRLVVESL